jgi:predicted  nucleic acid-binding Zn-ribbon protein
MKSIKEKQFLVNLAKALGQNADPNLVKEINSFNNIKKDAHESIKRSALKDLTEAFKGAKLENEVRQIIEYPLPPTLDEALTLIEEEKPKNELVQTQSEKTSIAEESLTPIPEPTLAERAAKFISEAPKDSFQQPDPEPVDKNFAEIQRKLKFLEAMIGKIAVAGPGGGAVNLKDLDDVSRYTVVNAIDGQILTYNAQSKLWVAKNHAATDIVAALSSDKHLIVNANGQIAANVYATKRSMSNITLFGSFSDNTTQSCNANTATIIRLGSTDVKYGINLSNANTHIVFTESGVYNIQFSAQLTNSDNQSSQAFIWFRKNGTDIADSASVVTVPAKHAKGDGATIAAWNYFITINNPNEYAEIAWFTSDETKVQIRADVAANLVVGVSPPIPRIPSVIVTVSHVI